MKRSRGMFTVMQGVSSLFCNRQKLTFARATKYSALVVAVLPVPGTRAATSRFHLSSFHFLFSLFFLFFSFFFSLSRIHSCTFVYIYSFLHLFYIYTLLYIYSVIINIHARARAFTGCIANRSIGFFVRYNHWNRGWGVETFNCTEGDRIFNEQSCFFSTKGKRGKKGTAIRIEVREQRKRRDCLNLASERIFVHRFFVL